jgi:hypothetical protein
MKVLRSLAACLIIALLCLMPLSMALFAAQTDASERLTERLNQHGERLAALENQSAELRMARIPERISGLEASEHTILTLLGIANGLLLAMSTYLYRSFRRLRRGMQAVFALEDRFSSVEMKVDHLACIRNHPEIAC